MNAVAIIGQPSKAAAMCGCLIGIVAALLVASPAAGHYESPYTTGGGKIAAYGVAGNAVRVLYYHRIGGGDTPLVRGLVGQETIAHIVGPDGGPQVYNIATEAEGCYLSEPWPYSTVPDTEGPGSTKCFITGFVPPASTPGTYGILMPPSLKVLGVTTQVFDEWQVSGAITEGKCRTGDMGLGIVGDQAVPNTGGLGGVEGDFESGPEFRIWTDFNQGLGMQATINAHYAPVFPDTSPPLVTIAPSIDCALVEQGTTTLLADFACQEPDNLGSGVAACTGQDGQGEVADGEPLDTSTVGPQTLTVTGVDQLGNERSRTIHYTVEEANDAPTALSLAPTSVLESQPAGTAVGTFTTTDEDVGDTFTYSLVDGDGSADNESFSIDGNTLETAASFDYHVKNSFSIRVRTTDQGGKWFERQFTITVDNIIDPYLSSNTVAENEPAGTIVGRLDDDENRFLGESYRLVSGPGDTDNASFYIETIRPPGEGSQTLLKTAASFDYEAKSSYTIRVRMEFSGYIREKALTIHVTNVFEGSVRPLSATPLKVSLVPSFRPCATPNRTHGPPLDSGSCAPPVPGSSALTVGTPDSNGAAVRSVSSVRLAVQAGSDTTPADDADVRIAASIRDVRNRSDLSDYTGQVQTVLGIRLTDGRDVANADPPQTTQDFSFRVKVPCASTGNTAIGSSCTLETTADTLVPGLVPEGERSVWALDAVHVYDAGPDQNIDTSGDNAVFMTQGVFVP